MAKIGDRIDLLGYRFRGLWRSCEILGDDTTEDKWCVTFIYQDKYVETPYRDTAEEALDYALEKVKIEKTKPLVMIEDTIEQSQMRVKDGL
jgi:hypothetical protein